jgi:hypothetical protein
MTQPCRKILLVTSLLAAGLLTPRIGHTGKVRSRASKHLVPTWKWDVKATKLSWYIARYKGKHRLSAPTRAGLFRAGTVQVIRRGHTVARFKAHSETAFVILADRVLVYSVHHPISTGCTLVAFDLKRRRQLWKTHLKGIGPVGHSKYRNRINLEAGPGQAVTVFGWESFGRYLEVVDLKTGKTLTHQKLPH